jgi:hypothetical protein
VAKLRNAASAETGKNARSAWRSRDHRRRRRPPLPRLPPLTLLDAVAVLRDLVHLVVLALLLLLGLDARQHAPRGAARADDVLVGDAQQVTLLDVELRVQLGQRLHVLHHVVVALRLLGELRLVGERERERERESRGVGEKGG